MLELAMSVEETIQPSFTVTANAVQLATVAAPDVPTSQTSPPSPDSYANQSRPDMVSHATTAESISDQQGGSESLDKWTISRKKANDSAATFSSQARAIKDKQIVSGSDAEASRQAEEAELEKDKEDTVFGPDIAELDVASTTEAVARESEPEIPSPVNTPSPPPGEAQLTMNGCARRSKRSTTPIRKPRPADGFQPINRYSPLRNGNFAIPSPTKSKSAFSRKPKAATKVEQDSFAEDHVKRHQVEPVAKLTSMLGNYTSGTSNGSRPTEDLDKANEAGGGQDEDERIPRWEESVMRPAETVPVEVSPQVEVNGVDDAGSGGPANDDSVERNHHSHPPSPGRPSSRSSPSQSPPPRRSGFNALVDEEDSSLGMPSEVRFSQELEFESQHSTRSTGPVATQTLASHPAYLSSPPPSPPRAGAGEAQSHSTRETGTSRTTSTHSHPRSLPPIASAKGDGNTQEATQLVTEDELISRPSAAPPTIMNRRTLPTAAARRAGRDVISQPADRSRMNVPREMGPHTIAGPQAAQAGRQSRNGPPALEDTYIDPQTQRPESDQAADAPRSGSLPDVEMRSPSPPLGGNGQTDAIQREAPLPTEAESNDHSETATTEAACRMEATYVDPTLTSLPPPAPKRPTPAKYGKQRANPILSPATVATPTPINNQLTPPPTAGQSRSPAELPKPIVEQPKATKSGRISKRRRRESSATMSSSSSSSEDVDVYDESYRPAIAKPAIKVKGKGKATNPSLKRVKNGRSRSGSRASSAAGPSNSKEPVEVSTPLTTLSEDADIDDRPWVIAWWSPRWYIGRIRSIVQGKYDVDYEDGTHSAVPIDKVRRGCLVVGDRVKDEAQKNEEFIVLEDWAGDVRGVKVKGRRIPLARISIRQSVIRDDFQDRLVTPKELGFDFDPPSPPHRPPIATTSKSVSSSSDVFAGKIFFVTSASAPNRVHQRDANALVTRHGGKFVEKWYDLFDLPSSGFGSTLASTSAPFLIQETSQASLTPKALISLAKGIPCLSMAYIDDAIADPTVDWRSYLVESGFSERLQQHCSQVINGTWGSEGWNAGVAQAERRPFMGKRFLFLEPRDKREIKRLILVCLHAMGAVAVDCVQNLTSAKETDGYDFVLVEDRDKKRELPDWLIHLEQACNIPWLKQCLIMGACLKPGLIKDK